MQPNFHDNTSTTPARRDAFYVDGRYAALYIISQAAGPSPISPFVIFAATQMSRKALGELSLSLIHVLDPTSARILHPWFDVLADTTWLPNNIATTPWAAAVHMLLEHYLPDLPVNCVRLHQSVLFSYKSPGGLAFTASHSGGAQRRA